MSLNTLYPFQHSYTDPLPNRQGRSKKKLRSVVTYQGGFYIARKHGRPERFFGRTQKEALANMGGSQ